MAKYILNNPSPDVLMNSMRSIGYSFKTAVADIIDNSISAHASEIKIYTPINDDLFISFFDNGEGMSRDELLNAMKYGSDRECYGIDDLGRFGLGLKSASLSQCRKLTVASKKDGVISAFRWDLDSVIETKRWDCLELENDEIKQLPMIKVLTEAEKGTLVVWQDFDIAYKKSNGHVMETLSEEVDEMEKGLNGWSGPEPTHKDFSYKEVWFEIKSINSFKNSVSISSLEQLDSELPGHLVVYNFEKMSSSFAGITLNKLVALISKTLQYETDRDIFFAKLKQVGYSYNEVYDNYVYNLIKVDSYLVDDRFPRIKADTLPSGITKVQYDVLLSMIEKNKEA